MESRGSNQLDELISFLDSIIFYNSQRNSMDNQNIIKNNLDFTLFSWVQQGGLNPINASHAKGVYIQDRTGKKYLDFSSQLMNVNIGHVLK